MSDSTPTLEPCPFCGSADIEFKGPDGSSFSIICTNCCAEMPYMSLDDPQSERWNTRAALDASGNDERWQPIETAPIGEWALIYVPGASVTGVAKQYGNGSWGDDNGTYMRPSHWQPLPEPPAAIARTQEQSDG